MDDINQLEKLGLNRTEIRVYYEILKQGGNKMDKIAAASNVPLSRIYDVVKGLRDKGFIKEISVKPKKYVAVNPEEIINIKVSDIESNFKDLGGKLMELWEKNIVEDKKEISFSVTSSYSTLTECKRIVQNSKKEIKFYLGSFWDYIKLRNFFPKVKKKKLLIKILTDKDISKLDGMQIKKVDNIDLQFLIVDDKELFLILEPSPRDFHGIYINNEKVTKILSNFFDSRWS
jgi:sugar-specific transcriptional regulator TrmB